MYFKYSETHLNHLKSKNAQMAKLIEHFGFIERTIYTSSFKALVCIIIEQQIATKTAKNIINNIENDILIDKNEFFHVDLNDFKKYGLSQSKINTIIAITDLYRDNENIGILESSNYDAIYQLLIQVKGIGPWSIQNYFMFYKCDINMFLQDDLVLNKAIEYLHIENFNQVMFAPYNTIAAFYL